jgi:hypothetical protein
MALSTMFSYRNGLECFCGVSACFNFPKSMSLPEGNTPFPKSWHRQYASVAWVEHMVQNAR